ncbi:MAG TPA: FliM/FliN family flagellar motor C-terminal domain-containing protein [Polyangia bacterium]|jgi:flagellar motor switch protein FliN|nr:FliM/FliN family flagellar motor C-terminal domain-containing protein [Polyangia bacterium]
MDLAVLDPAELAAIRSAIGGDKAGGAQTSGPPGEATPIALIADDRSADRARPDALKLGQRWAQLMKTRLGRKCNVKLEIEAKAADLADSSLFKEQLAVAWANSIEVSGRAHQALVSVSGAMVEGLGAKMLGSNDPGSERAPSKASLRIFAPVGESILLALTEAWRDEQACDVRTIAADGEGWRRALGETDSIVELTLDISGWTTGRVRLWARPETLVMPPPALKVVPASPATIRAVLGEVPIELRADLGRATLSMSEVATLQPGALVMLDRAVDEPLPVYVAGRLVAHATVIVSRGALAVKIVDVEDE